MHFFKKKHFTSEKYAIIIKTVFNKTISKKGAKDDETRYDRNFRLRKHREHNYCKTDS